MTERILVTCAQMQAELPTHRDRLNGEGFEVVAPELRGQQFRATELTPMMSGVVGLIAGDDELPSLIHI